MSQELANTFWVAFKGLILINGLNVPAIGFQKLIGRRILIWVKDCINVNIVVAAQHFDEIGYAATAAVDRVRKFASNKKNVEANRGCGQSGWQLICPDYAARSGLSRALPRQKIEERHQQINIPVGHQRRQIIEQFASREMNVELL